jgi:hypothetical protein
MFAAFLCEYVAWVGMLESAIAIMNGFYFDFEEVRVNHCFLFYFVCLDLIIFIN